jgi:hypothetical protein
VRAIAIAAPAIDRRIAVVFECIDTIPPGKDLCMTGDDVWDTHGTLRHDLANAGSRRQSAALRCAQLGFGLPTMAGNRVAVKGALDWVNLANTSNANKA